MTRYVVALITTGLCYSAEIIEAEDEREAAEQYLMYRNPDSGRIYVVAVEAAEVVKFYLDVTTQSELRRETPE